ncbi:hypothetical protein GYH30_017134 [Glycine max]|uniref:Uncharacterized protein n=2 Tax=Glycine subgen. Soja TaxID=1462606 RepID=K7KZ48_SOYBN|nr:hypothetical protein GYH30_017134 [Glycine max]RZC00940.1 putative beta-1,4-xylosyltransferase IRX14 [Glycine soja]
MKLSALQQSYLSRWANNFRGLAEVAGGDFLAGNPASAVSLAWFSTSTSRASSSSFSQQASTSRRSGGLEIVALHDVPPTKNRTAMASTARLVVVGRHGIRIRPWPHSDLGEVMKAHRISRECRKSRGAIRSEKP